MPPRSLSDADLAFFQQHGYLIVRGLFSRQYIVTLRGVAQAELAAARPPLELEADTGYPGAPPSAQATGGHTIRRLLQAADRHADLRQAAVSPLLAAPLRQLLGAAPVLAAAHHNCIMTKQPAWSSLTGWHQDIRYWSFQRPELVSAWIALGDERPENGCLWLVPGSHRWALASRQLDHRQFFRDDLAENQVQLQQRVAAELEPGDVLFFHCLTLHAADRNSTDAAKLSLVFTYRGADNLPLPGTRSDHAGDIALS